MGRGTAAGVVISPRDPGDGGRVRRWMGLQRVGSREPSDGSSRGGGRGRAWDTHVEAAGVCNFIYLFFIFLSKIVTKILGFWMSK